MSLGKLMVESLRRLAADGPEAVNGMTVGGDASRLSLAAAGAQARLDFADHDRYSIALRAIEVELEARTPPEHVRAELHTRSAEIIRRLGYLEEPLAVWELEEGARTAQLRSSPPQREAEQLWYWEVTLQAGERPAAHIARYHWAPGMAERELVVYPATFALVGRITESLEVALAAPVE